MLFVVLVSWEFEASLVYVVVQTSQGSIIKPCLKEAKPKTSQRSFSLGLQSFGAKGMCHHTWTSP